MASKTQIANMALGHLGHSTTIADITTEESKEARAVNEFYDTARDALLRAYPWNFATEIGTLSLVAETADGEYGYRYERPADVLTFRRIANGSVGLARVRTAATDVKWRMTGTAILTDQPDAIAEWTVRVDDPTLYPPDFTLALSFYLAWLIAPRITSGDPNKMGQAALRNYDYQLRVAMMADANEDGPDLPAESEFITVRG